MAGPSSGCCPSVKAPKEAIEKAMISNKCDAQLISRELNRFDNLLRGFSADDRITLCRVIEALRDAPAPLNLEQLEAMTGLRGYFLKLVLALGIERNLIRKDDDSFCD